MGGSSTETLSAAYLSSSPIRFEATFGSDLPDSWLGRVAWDTGVLLNSPNDSENRQWSNNEVCYVCEDINK